MSSKKPITEEKYAVSVIGKDLFHHRMNLEDRKFGHIIYEQIIALLELIGEEDIDNNEIPYLRLGVYLESCNDGQRKFLLGEKQFLFFKKHFGHRFFDKVKEFAKREQIKGSNILFQLNNGNISLQDFADKLESPHE